MITTVTSAFADFVVRDPSHVAIVEGRHTKITYGELDARAERLAKRLARVGVARGDHVAILLDRGADAITAMLATLRLGAAYLAIDTTYPKGRISYLLEDARPRVVVVGKAHADDGSLSSQTRTVLLAEPDDYDGEAAELRWRPVVAEDDIAYLIYTSGSTGKPKGVEISHRNLIHLLSSHHASSWIDLDPSRTVLHAASLGFDASVFEIWAALLNGGTLAIHPERVPTANGLRRTIEEAGVTTALLPTSVFNSLVDDDPCALTGIEHLFIGGEALSTSHVEKAMHALPKSMRFTNAYGPAECTVISTVWPIDAATLSSSNNRSAAIAPIGKAITKSVSLFLFDPERPEVEVKGIGEIGELYVGGVGVARGYWNREALTNERFVRRQQHGGDVLEQQTLYRTGDLVRLRPDGNLEYLGRCDTQVKVSGIRVELGEIEETLKRVGGFSNAVVVLREERLIAYVVATASEGVAFDPSTLRAALFRDLPHQIVPVAYVLLDALPLTTHGKIDRSALPAPSPDCFARSPIEAPRTELESRVAAFVAEIVKIGEGEVLSIHDDFFALGGSSLDAVRLCARLRSEMKVDLSPSALFEARTIADLCHRIVDASAVAVVERTSTTMRDDDRDLSRQERWMLMLDSMAPIGAYNVHVTFWVVGVVGVGPHAIEARLAEAIRHVVKDHEILRTTYDAARGKAKAFDDDEEASWPKLTVVRVASEDEAVRVAQATIDRPYDLRREPPVRPLLCVVTSKEGGRSLFCWAAHHVAFDGSSVAVLLAAIDRAWQLLPPHPHPQPQPQPQQQYRDYVARQTNPIREERNLAYWKRELSNPPLSPPLVTATAAAPPSLVAAAVPIDLRPDFVTHLDALARSFRTTRLVVLLAAWSVFVGRHTRTEDVIVGVPFSGRSEHETEQMIGCFIQTLPIRVTWDASSSSTSKTSFGQLLQLTQRRVALAMAHHEVRLDQIELENVDVDRQQHPLFRTLFVYQTLPSNAHLGPLTLTRASDLRPTPTSLDVAIELFADDDGVRGTLCWRSGLFDVATGQRLVERYLVLLSDLARDPSACVNQATMMSNAERQTLLDLGRGPVIDLSARPKTIGGLLEQCAAEMPEHPAIIEVDGVDGEHSTTFAAMNAEANALAHRLRRQGVTPNAFVPLLVERSRGAILIIHALLKIGAAFVPLDPDAPTARIDAQLGELGSNVVVITTRLLRDRVSNHRVIVFEEIEREGSSTDVVPTTTTTSTTTPTPTPIPTGQTAAYAIYTSGSTGRPKAVVCTHDNVINHATWIKESFAIGRGDRILHLTSLTFDVAIWEIVSALVCGVTVLVPPKDAHRDPAAVLAIVKSARATILQFVPSTLQGFLEAGGPPPPSLRWVFCGGEALQPALVARFRDRFGEMSSSSCQLVNAYGPTEATIDATFLRVSCTEKSVPIGRPIANASAFVLEPNGDLAPFGVPGELHLGGRGLARGYLEEERLTEERFTENPHLRERLYRTGDLACVRAEDGHLEFLGRVDRQIKIRGVRIEPGEIEAALVECPNVSAAAVIVKKAPDHLVAFIEATSTPRQVRSFLRGRLPIAMLPSIVIVSELPHLPSGKIACAELATLSLPESKEEESPPQRLPETETERAICAVFAETLGRSNVGVSDDFFTLGGNSLLATRAVAKLRSLLGIDLQLRDLFDHPQAEDLAKKVDSDRAREIEL